MRIAIFSTLLFTTACLENLPSPIENDDPPASTDDDDDPPSNDPVTPPPGPTSDPMTYLRTFDQKFCVVAFSCRDTYPGDVPFETMYGANPIACQTVLDGQIDIANLARDVEEGYIVYNRFAAQECLDALVPNACVGMWTADYLPEVCGNVFLGQIADGDPCRIDADCLNSDSVCDTGSCRGTLD